MEISRSLPDAGTGLSANQKTDIKKKDTMPFQMISCFQYKTFKSKGNSHDPMPLHVVIRLCLLLFEFERDPWRQNLHHACLTIP